MIYPGLQLDPLYEAAYAVGRIKASSDATPAYNLSGMLYLSERSGQPWILLSAPNSLAKGVFSAMNEPGLELPLLDGKLEAHITVFSPTDIQEIGGADKLVNDRGKHFTYTIGRLVEIVPEHGDNSKVFCLRVHSPSLQQLRRSYGLSGLPHGGARDFHITCAVVKKGILGRNNKSKGLTPG